MKPNNVKSMKYIDFNVENKDRDCKYKASAHVRILKHKNINAKAYPPNWLEEVLLLKKSKWKYVINDLNSEEIVGKFYEK